MSKDKQLCDDYEQAGEELIDAIREHGMIAPLLPPSVCAYALSFAKQYHERCGGDIDMITGYLLDAMFVCDRVRVIREERAERLSNLN